MRIEDFIERDEILCIFEEKALVEPYDFLMALEMYKFCTRAHIIDRINSLRKFTDVAFDVKNVNRNSELRKIESDFNVIIDIRHTGQATVLYSITKKINKDSLELALSRYKVEYRMLTPYNFRCLNFGVPRSLEYDPSMLFKRVLLETLDVGATDLHFCVEHRGMAATYPIKVRKDGALRELCLFELDSDLNQAVITELIENDTYANSFDLTTTAGVTTVSNDPLHNGKIELRIAANRVEDGWHCVIRIQRKETFSFDIPNLGFNQVTQDALMGLVKKHSGIVFITGAIRTGKNTTAFAVLNEIIKEPVKIVSYESPAEVLMPFTQVDYKNDYETLVEAVRLAKKQDVDIAYINEIPNREVAFAVRDLVNSSVFVITTMHVDRLWHLPYKLKEYYGENYKDIISQIDTVFNQKMFGIPCPECQDSILSESLDKKFSSFLLSRNVNSVKINRGCNVCNDTGLIDGRNQPYVEFLEFTPSIKEDLLKCNEPYQMETLLRDYLMKSGNSLEDVMANAIDRGSLSIDALESIL